MSRLQQILVKFAKTLRYKLEVIILWSGFCVDCTYISSHTNPAAYNTAPTVPNYMMFWFS